MSSTDQEKYITEIEKNTTTKERKDAPWQVRGVSKEIQIAAKRAAKKEGKKLGQWVSLVVHQASLEAFRRGTLPAKIEEPHDIIKNYLESLKSELPQLISEAIKHDKLQTKGVLYRLGQKLISISKKE